MINKADKTLEINTRLFRQIQRAVKKWPESFDMNNPGYFMEFNPETMKEPSCGTPACLFGWATTLGDKKSNRKRMTTLSIFERARELLGLTFEQADHFYNGRFSKRRRKRTITPEEACRAIDMFLESEGAELPRL